ncbi:MAG: hypothetical protein Q4E94_03770, partial [Clostridia bacterium]|nr:hypothetical protein [Clostridia bacterium]
MKNKIKRIAAVFLAICLAGVFNAASLAPMTTTVGAELSLEGYSRNLSFEFYDNFDGYADKSAVLESWTVAEDIHGAVSLVGIDGKNKALSVAESNISFNDAKNRYITKTFGTVLTEDKFTVKISAGMELSLINTENEEIPLFSGNKSGISCYTSDSDFETINEYTLSSSEYKRIKIIVDKAERRFNIVTSGINKTYAYTQDIGSVAGIRVRAKKGSSSMLIDEVSVKSSSDENSVYAAFNGGKSFDGGLFYSSMGAGADGLSLNCAEKVTNVTDGSTEYKMNIADGTLQIDVDSDRLSEVLEFGNIGVEITYLDKGYGFIHAQYDTTAGKKELPAICMYNSGMKVSETVDANLEEKRQTYTLDDWVKNPDSGGYRLKIKTYEGEIEDGKQLRSGDRIYSKYPVTIKSIRLYDMGTAAPVKIELDTDKTGNIFYEGDTPKIKINLQNKSAENVKGSCRVICYKKNKNDSYRNPDETEVYNTYFGASVPAGEAYGAELVFPVTEFGLYRVTAEFTNDALGIAAAAETEFSRCVRVATQNYTVGVSSHLDQEGYADESLKLMKNAGLGLVREDFIWSDYEVKTGGDSTNGYTTEFRLNEKQEATLDAIDKYDMRLLMIVSGISWWHEGAHGNGSGFPSQQAIDLYFNDYVTHLLSEPKLIKVCDMVEVWNEPELTSQQDGVFLGDISLSGEAATAARFRKRGEAYGGLLDSVSQTIQYLNKSKGLDYRIGAFSLVTPWYPDTNYFMDNALNKLNDPKRSYYFDTISVHPYIWLSQDPEIGFGGSDNSNQMHYLGYKLDYVKALASGGSV